MGEILSYEFVQNAIVAGALASLLCGLVGTFVVVQRLVFVSGGVSHAAFGGLGFFYFLGLEPLLGAAASAVLAALVLTGSGRSTTRSQDAVIGILWAVGMAVGVVFIARAPGFAPNLATYLFGDILAVGRPLIAALALLATGVLVCVTVFFKELLAVSFDEEFARSQGVSTRVFLLLLMVMIAFSVVLLIQVVGSILVIALLTIPPVISLSLCHSFRAVIVTAVGFGLVMTMGGLAISFIYDLPSGPTIVLLGFGMLLISKLAERLRTRRSRATMASLALLVVLPTWTSADSPLPTAVDAGDPVTSYRHLDFLGEAHIPASTLEGVPVGGLSGLAYDATTDRYFAVSDDRAERGPARFYTLAIDLRGGQLAPNGVEVLSATPLTTIGGQSFGPGRIDPEAIAIRPQGTFIIASEGDARIELEPFLREFDRNGRQLRDFSLGERYIPRIDQQSGVRDNLALESATLGPSGRFLFSATENALAQDGPKSDLDRASPGRILRYDIAADQLDAEYLYWIDPVVEAPVPANGFSVSGVVDMIALDDSTLFVLERSFSVGRGNDVRLYEVDLSGAENILAIEALALHGAETIRPARKRLLMHIDRLGIEPDNLEGMTFGPRLSDGRSTLLLISDDNFDTENQVNQVLAFALQSKAPTVPEIQGRGHRSPYQGDWLRQVAGIVTAVDRHPERGGFWLQHVAGDGDEATSDGIFVALPATTVRIGDRALVDGAVREIGFEGALSVTTLDAAVVRITDGDQALPQPVSIGVRGRRPPTVVIDDDRMAHFDPCCDAIDFFESLEGMRVQIEDSVAVGATSRFGEVAVLVDGGRGAALRTSRGGILLRAGDPNPERILLDDRLAPGAPDIGAGDSFNGSIRGIVDYGFGNFKLLVERWPAVEAAGERPSRVRRDRPDEVSFASYNVLNLDALDDETKFAQLAATIVDDLGSPAVLGLQEVQDDNGARDEGVVAAGRTLDRLVEAIVAAGGPRYEYRQIDPEHNADGGQPNGNIRVVFLLDPGRAEPVDRRADTPSRGGLLPASPVRLAIDDPAFAGDPERGWQGGRKCLAIEAMVAGEPLVLINCHLKSKLGDDRWFGARQPPVFASEEQRSAQIRAVLAVVDEILAGDPSARIVVLGDMNELGFRSPMRLFGSGRLLDLAERVPAADRYTFNFNGNSQLLDHILLSPALVDRVTDVTIVHVNSDRPDSERASDHDPVLVRLRLP